MREQTPADEEAEASSHRPEDDRIIGDLAIIVPTIGRDSLRRCLKSVVAGTRWPSELILVDQGENPDVESWVGALRSLGIDVHHLRAPRRGAAAARNLAFKHVRTRFLAATDDDCIVAADWLARLHDRLQAHPDALITGQVDAAAHAGGGEAPSIIRRSVEEIHRRPLLDRDPLSSGNMGLSRDVLERIGPMDEHPTLMAAEDAEWSYRALRAGIPIVYAPEVRVSHLEWRDPESLSRTYRAYARSQGAFYGAYVRRGDLFAARRMAFDLLRGPWILIRGLIGRNHTLRVVGKAYMRCLIPGFLEGLGRSPGGQPS